MDERLSKAEIRKDAIQDGVGAAAATVGRVTNIVVGAVEDVAKAVGGFATEIFEIRDAARRAAVDHEPGADHEPGGNEKPLAEPDVHPDPDAALPTQPDVHPDPDAPTG